MSIPQTSVVAQAQTFAGVIADESPLKVDSYVNAESSASIPFGGLVIQGTNDNEALAVTSSGKPLGIVAHSHVYSKAHGDFAGDLDSTGLVPGVMMNVVSQGVIFVTLCETLKAGDAVRVIHTADTGKAKFTFCKTADAGKSAVLSGAKWVEGGSSGGVAKLWVDMNGATLTADT